MITTENCRYGKCAEVTNSQQQSQKMAISGRGGGPYHICGNSLKNDVWIKLSFIRSKRYTYNCNFYALPCVALRDYDAGEKRENAWKLATDAFYAHYRHKCRVAQFGGWIFCWEKVWKLWNPEADHCRSGLFFSVHKPLGGHWSSPLYVFRGKIRNEDAKWCKLKMDSRKYGCVESLLDNADRQKLQANSIAFCWCLCINWL